MTTPTPGDLSARLRGADVLHMRMLSEMARPVPGSPEGVAWLAAEAYREVAHAALAALSALPAAVGTDFAPRFTESQARGWKAVCATLDEIDPDWILEGHTAGKTGVQRACDAIRRLATTPQPSTAEDADTSCYCMGPDVVCPNCEQPDAAVGAQGDGCKCQPFDELGIHDFRCPVLDAPAAGKGVDELIAVLIDNAYSDGASDMPCMSEQTEKARADLQAALTRQPVAGDRAESVDKAVRQARRFYFQHNPPNTLLANEFNEILRANGTFESDLAANQRREATAAPTDTPADGGEG